MLYEGIYSKSRQKGLNIKRLEPISPSYKYLRPFSELCYRNP